MRHLTLLIQVLLISTVVSLAMRLTTAHERLVKCEHERRDLRLTAQAFATCGAIPPELVPRFNCNQSETCTWDDCGRVVRLHPYGTTNETGPVVNGQLN